MAAAAAALEKPLSLAIKQPHVEPQEEERSQEKHPQFSGASAFHARYNIRVQLSCPGPGTLNEPLEIKAVAEAAAQDKGRQQPRQCIALRPRCQQISSGFMHGISGAELKQIALFKDLRGVSCGHFGRTLSRWFHLINIKGNGSKLQVFM